MTIQRAFEKFIMKKKLACLTEKTVKCYEDYIKMYIRFVGNDLDINELTEDINDMYISGVINRKIALSTKGTYIRYVKIFLKWIEEEYDINVYAKKIKVPKTEKKILRIYTNDEIVKIYESVETEKEWLTLRNKLIISLMLDSGLRQNEVCMLLRKDIYMDNGIIKVYGKGRKERLVPIGKITQGYINMYYEKCPYSTERVIVSRRGNYMSGDAIKHFMYKLADKLQFEFSSHKLRHNFATNYCLDRYRNGHDVDIYKLMIIMGHEDIETTRKYLHTANQIIITTEKISHIDNIFINEKKVI